MHPFPLNIRGVLSAMIFCFAIILPDVTLGQTKLTHSVSGYIKSNVGNALPGASVYVMENPRLGTSADVNGKYTIELPHSGPWNLKCSMIGFTSAIEPLIFEGKETAKVNFRLESIVKIGEAEVVGSSEKNTTIKKLDPRIAHRIPTPRGTIEDVLMQAPVNFTSELSSSYNVRGGSFDENLVYVNDIEVYRPFLTRAGQQGGFPSPTLIW